MIRIKAPDHEITALEPAEDLNHRLGGDKRPARELGV